MKKYSVGLVLLVVMILTSGCATFGEDIPRHPSYALEDGAHTLLGRAFAAQQIANPGQSGFDLLATGPEALLARAALADAAEHTLDLQYYSVAQDATTDLLLERIVGAARRGVRVRMLLDDIDESARAFAARALNADPGIQVRLFHPFLSGPWFGGRLLEFLADGERLNRRMHNKLWAADNAVAIFGSRNLGSAYFEAEPTGNFFDVDLIAAGPVVRDLSRGFDEYWNSKSAIPFVTGAPKETERIQRADAEAKECSRTECRGSNANTYLRLIESAELPLVWAPARVTYDKPHEPKLPPPYGIQHGMSDVSPDPDAAGFELLFISPYFIPSREGLEHLGDMRRRGVRIAVLTNSLASTDAPAAHAGYARYRADLLRCGVELFEFRPVPGGPHPTRHLWARHASAASLHAKVIVIDRRRAIVGSMNQDPRSRLYNTESWVSIDSPALAGKLADLFEESTQMHHSFRLRTRGDVLEWVTQEGGLEVRYESDPLASAWKRFLSGVTSMFVPEDLL